MKTRVAFVSLGCDKNLVDSEVMLGLINEAGYEIIQDEQEADVLVINTCAFIHDAKQESIENILELAEYKKTGNCKALIVAGCLGQRYHNEILTEMPEIDAIVGTLAYDKIVQVIQKTLSGDKVVCLEDINKKEIEGAPRIITTVGHYEFLKIAEGCYNHCTYCIIPKLRGSFRSKSMDSLVGEAEILVKNGVKELIIVAQDVTSYGVDFNGEYELPQLLRRLCKIEDLKWIRLLYCYPERISDELINTIKTEDKICKYIDMPLQHINDEILKKMGRNTTKDKIVKLITKIRLEIPDITLRTTFIVGFPGESKQNIKELREFIEETQFDRLGIFTYSEEEDTPAALLKPKVSTKEKERRKTELMQVQENIVERKATGLVGKVLEVVIEGKLQDEDVYMGRTYRDTPDVDGLVFLNSDKELMVGEFVQVRITESSGYDLVGEINFNTK
ncbi:MAG TPA: 30S ribosomal protein S12 methylthiotransferase RimO [Clostridiales bacterium]|nr:MAG: ribosomal protein S12 methylthiotransferase RimO [Clostridiales bacterium GWD2_32_19]HCC08307.1 30S ribosomal protein S12 methylthiotransferase RimO [Clostridiales bacterium]